MQDILLSDTESEPDPSDEDEYIRDMLREHVKEKKIRAKYYQNPHVSVIFLCFFDYSQLNFGLRIFKWNGNRLLEFTIWLLWS